MLMLEAFFPIAYNLGEVLFFFFVSMSELGTV